MNNFKKSGLMKAVILFLVFSLIFPVCANAAVVQPAQPMASDYFTAYNTYACPMGNGRIEVWYDILGDTTMDEIGALSIIIYESIDGNSWTRVKTFLHEEYPGMLIYNDYFCCTHVNYQGIAGRYYKARVCLWAGKNGNGDSRYMWTPVELAI